MQGWVGIYSTNAYEASGQEHASPQPVIIGVAVNTVIDGFLQEGI